MYAIKSPDKFITTPWKNGLGETTELAINQGASLTNFDWRISMAKVTQDGVFSDFSGYFRQLILIAGNGINLQHKSPGSERAIGKDKLTHVLDIAEFDGGNQTFGELINGEIIDLNVITDSAKVVSQVTTVTEQQTITIETDERLLLYPVTDKLNITVQEQSFTLARGYLFHWLSDDSKNLQVSGQNFILIELSKK
ncbi:hypothetical protein tinsulaeT_32080 [Thalassotalea insulae]|uniref:HutD family protein n=1 Tax=Thalassotalea insulae TaxID=2056778 RepID=A0ABQ6GVA6_9GAMM|nr:HutD family protein [Thalassotalea insulae]GLX79868.1 hypothetical protein tinsulaeT_32080 [Thalassotalea insulae]